MLKAAFYLQGYEAMLTDYTQASFIFDEIHAYEPARLALILVMVEYLQKNFDVRFFVMSATSPSIIREKLFKSLDLPSDPFQWRLSLTTDHGAMTHLLIEALYLHQTAPSMRLPALPLASRFSGAGSDAFVWGHHSTVA